MANLYPKIHIDIYVNKKIRFLKKPSRGAQYDHVYVTRREICEKLVAAEEMTSAKYAFGPKITWPFVGTAESRRSQF